MTKARRSSQKTCRSAARTSATNSAAERHCEICDAVVVDLGDHYTETPRRPHQSGYWKCHPDLGKWRCAKCEHLWAPKSLNRGALPACPSCGEKDDVFPADDGGWERAARERNDKGHGAWDYDGY